MKRLILAAFMICGLGATVDAQDDKHSETLDAIHLAGIRAQFPGKSEAWILDYARRHQPYRPGQYDSPGSIERKLSAKAENQRKLDALEKEEAALDARLEELQAKEKAEEAARKEAEAKAMDDLRKQNAEILKRLEELTAKKNTE